MPQSPQPDDRSAALRADAERAGARQPSLIGHNPAGIDVIRDSKLDGNRELQEPELEAALQLLVERAQYITGATGTALALPQGDEMVCRASAGSCAPAVGARLQVRSGLTGESIARRQLLRCDNAEADPRVNLEACRALGIASIVVLPLLRRSGEVRGLFELFSDHPYAFEERDLVALERMADLTLTALDLAEQHHGAIPPPPPGQQTGPKQSTTTGTSAAGVAPALAGTPIPFLNIPTAQVNSVSQAVGPGIAAAEAPQPNVAEPAPEPSAAAAIETHSTEAASPALPEAMQRVQKCAKCGFPVSEGRTFCLDCDNKDGRAQDPGQPGSGQNGESPSPSAEEALPPFLAKAVPVKESWLANHVNLLAILVLILGVLVAVVVFR